MQVRPTEHVVMFELDGASVAVQTVWFSLSPLDRRVHGFKFLRTRMKAEGRALIPRWLEDMLNKNLYIMLLFQQFC